MKSPEVKIGWGKMGGVCGARRLYSYNSFDARINEASVERFQMLKEIQNSKSSKLFPL